MTVHTSDDARLKQGFSSHVEDGTITGTSESGDVVARYDGNVEEIEHEGGTTVEIQPSSKRIVCEAPEDTDVTFEAEASEAVVYDREAHWQATVSVGPGETEKIKYYGRPTTVSIDELEVSIGNEVYEDAVNSAKLQRAAEAERATSFEIIDEAINGRIRHDAESLFLGSVADDEPKDTVAFQIDDIDDGDHGTAYLHRDRSTDETESAGYEIQWLTDNEIPETVEINNLQTEFGASSVGTAFETKTFEHEEISTNIAASEETSKQTFEGGDEVQRVDTSGVEPQLIPSIPSWVPSIPSADDIIDAFGDAVSSFADHVGTTQDEVAGAVSTAVENAQDTTIEDIIIDSTQIISDTMHGLIRLVEEFEQRGSQRAIWALRAGFANTLYSLGSSGALQELADGNYNCGGCIAVIAVTVGVGLGVTASLTCSALGIGTLGLGGVACTTFFGAVFTYGETILFSEAEDICSGNHSPTDVNVC
ncbi:hypothetical protein [Halostagnicola bangensis]